MSDAVVYGPSQYDYKTSFFGDSAPLGQGVGYGIVVGFGAFFSILTTVMVRVLPCCSAGLPEGSGRTDDSHAHLC